jgi:hypothetical protein
MIYLYRRGRDTRKCESRLEPDGPGFELIVMEGRDSRVERFDDALEMARREHELRHAWLLHGWRAIEFENDFEEDL